MKAKSMRGDLRRPDVFVLISIRKCAMDLCCGAHGVIFNEDKCVDHICLQYSNAER